jgi:hypothetical protein
MTPATTSVPSVLTFDDLRGLAGAEGTCLSAAFRISEPAQARAQLNSHLDSMQHEMRRHFFGRASEAEKKLDEFLDPVREVVKSDQTWGRGVAFYRSAGFFQHFHLNRLSTDFVTVGDRFELRPLLSVMARNQSFYVLALSQKHTRLLRFANHRAEEAPLPEKTPRSLEDWMQTSTPDHVMDNRATAGPGVGSSKGILFGTNSDADREPQYLAHFFKAVDKGIHEVLRNAAPLFLAGVDFELAIYRNGNSYANLAQVSIHGAPDGMSRGELEKRALELTEKQLSAPLQKILDEFEAHRDKNRVLFAPHEILEASQKGRVRVLLIHEGAPRESKFNLAAIETLNHKGEAYALPAEEMPDGAAVVAILRY